MAELTQNMVEMRLERVLARPTPVFCPGLDGLGFVPLDAAARGRAARAYTERLMALFRQGYPSRRRLQPQLEEIARANGADPNAREKRLAIQAKLLTIPDHLKGPVDQLTEEEVAILPPEERERRQREIEERGREIVEWLQANLTEEDRQVLRDAEDLDAWEAELAKGTAEYIAEVWRVTVEIALAARRVERPEEPYFPSPDAVAALPERVLAKLYQAWIEYRDGLPSDFFSPSSSGQTAGTPS